MARYLRISAIASLFLLAAGCGFQDQNPPRPPADIPNTPPVAPSGPKTCTETLKSCPGGAVPTVDTATCKQTCPGE